MKTLKYITTLKRYHFKDRPDWQLVNEDVPLGTEYHILAFKPKGITIINLSTKEERPVMCYYVRRTDDGSLGWIPVDVFND